MAKEANTGVECRIKKIKKYIEAPTLTENEINNNASVYYCHDPQVETAQGFIVI